MKGKKVECGIITFDKSALKFLCEALEVPYDERIVAFTKKGAIKNVFELLELCGKEEL